MTMTVPDRPPAAADCVCGGGGMVFVDDDYVNRQAARRSDGVHAEPGLLEALRWTVIPCYECRPTQYRLWADGHYRPGHTCPTCRPRRKSSGKARS